MIVPHLSIVNLLVCLTSLHGLVSAADARREDRTHPTTIMGPGRGDAFTDSALTNGHKRLAYITLWGCNVGEHIEAMKVGYRDHNLATFAAVVDATHGKYDAGTSQKTLNLFQHEYISGVTVATYKKKVNRFSHRTRIGYIKIDSSLQMSLECGAKSSSDPVVTWPAPNAGAALLWFSGSAGDDIDSLQGHFAPLEDF